MKETDKRKWRDLSYSPHVERAGTMKQLMASKKINKVRENRCIAFHPSSLSVTHRYTTLHKKKRNIKTLLFDGDGCRNVLLLLLFKILIVCSSLCLLGSGLVEKIKVPSHHQLQYFGFTAPTNIKILESFASLSLFLQRCFLFLTPLITQRDLNLT